MLFLCFCPHPASTLAGVDLLRFKLDPLLYSHLLILPKGVPTLLAHQAFCGLLSPTAQPPSQSSPEGSMPVPASSPPELLSFSPVAVITLSFPSEASLVALVRDTPLVYLSVCDLSSQPSLRLLVKFPSVTLKWLGPLTQYAFRNL